jgi:hypothetical protein
MPLIEIFCEIDDFCKDFKKLCDKNLLTDGSGQRNRAISLSTSEVMTITVYYHYSGYKTFKDYYEKLVLIHLTKDFHNLVSYNRFIELKQKILFPLIIFFQLNGLKKCTGISFIDSFPLKVCHNRRISSHKTFAKYAKRGKTSVGWFYGFKLHLVINDLGEIIAFCITSGNVADNNKKVLLTLTKDLVGKLVGDKGYIVNPELFKKLFLDGIHLITKLKKNMENKLIPLADKLLLKKRSIIETVGGIMKEDLGLEHTQHRSAWGFLENIISTLIAYSFRKQKPSIAAATEGFALIA